MAGMEASTMTSLGNVQVGDAAVGVDHGQGGAVGQLGVEGGPDLLALGQRVQAR